jgi:autotransporter-associated beta strand protein
VGSGATLDINNWAWNGSLGELNYDFGNLVVNGGVLRYSGSTNTLDRDNAGRGFTVGSNGATFETVTSGVTWNLFRSPTAGDQPTFAGPVTLTGAGNGVMQHFIGGGSNLLKTGAGTWTLTGTNTYSGSSTISAGTLSVATTANLGNTSNVINLNGGTLTFTGSSAFSSSRAINVLTSSTINNANSGGLTFTGNNIALNGDVFAILTGFITTTLTAADFVFE